MWEPGTVISVSRPSVAERNTCWRRTSTHGQSYGIGAFELARRHLGLDVDCRVIEVADIDPSLRSFDVVLFLGVFYHLFDPLTALGRVASVTKDVLVVETHQEGVGFPAPIMTMFPSIELNRDPTN
jgi:tRNA (mo5U34)-methyltransferase